MNWSALRAKFDSLYVLDPQRAMKASNAVRALEAAIGELLSMGHLYKVEEGQPDPPLSWPKMVYHVNQPSREVRCQADLDDLGIGWWDTPQEAKLQDALGTQYEGRGGIAKPTQALAVIPDPAPSNPDQE